MLLSPTTSSRRRIAAGLTTLSLAAAAVVGSTLVESANAADPAALSGIVLGVGPSEQSRTLGWYTTGTAAEEVQLSTDKSFGTKTSIPATVTANTATGSVGTSNGKALLADLHPSSTYYYRIVESGTGSTSKTYSFKTQKFGAGDFDFLFFGDPQIGSSGDAVRDGDGWADTLSVATALNPSAELLVSGGDQVNTANNETEWTNFLRSDKLRRYPWAPTIGNHDVGGAAYEQHFALPSTIDRSDPLYTNAANKASLSGGDYWYTYKGVLFIDLNSNAYTAANGSDPAHVAFVKKVIEEHGADAQYTALVYHHSVYSPADHANDADNAQRRKDFTTEFSKLGVDLVLQGHDHSYSRSYVIKNGAKANKAEKPGATSVVTGPGGVVYVTSNSASGSKYYDLTEPDVTKNNGDYGPDPDFPAPDATGHVRHWANSVENQEHVRTFIKVQVKSDKLVVENIRAGECDGPNAAVERGNVSWCGPRNGADQALPVGSLQDHVDIRLTAPKPTPAPVKHLQGSTPRITGKAQVGRRLHAVRGTWTPGSRFSYRWLANGKAIKQAHYQYLRLDRKLVGKHIRVTVTGSHPGYTPASKSYTSRRTATVRR